MATSSKRRSEAPRPATHCQRNWARWSSNRTSALTTVGFMWPRWKSERSNGLRRTPLGDQLVQTVLGRAGLEALAQRAVAEQLGNFRQDFKVLLRGRLGHQQKDQQIDRLLVRGIKADRLAQQEDGGHRGLEPLDAAMRDGHAMTQSGGAQAFAGKQAIGHQRTRQAVQILKEKAGFFKSPLLAGGFNPHKNLGNGQDGRETVHVEGGLCTLPAHHPPAKMRIKAESMSQK